MIITRLMSCLPPGLPRMLALLSLVFVAACSGTRGELAADQMPPIPAEGAVPEYTLGPGDVVRVSVWKNEDLNVEVPVRPDGFISVPLIGDVRAGGRTPSVIVSDAEQKLTRFIRTPKVSIIVTQLNSGEFKNRVRVVGGVEEPKSVAHREGMTVIDLVLEAGGLTDFANPDRAQLIRTIDGVTNSYPIYLDAILVGGVVDTNYPLYPGDVVSIPERRF